MWWGRWYGIFCFVVFVLLAVVFPALGWYEWMWKQLAIGVVAMIAVALCFPVYFGLREPPRHE